MTTVAEYLATRLRQCGVEHVFGVPGDFSLALVEALSGPGGLEWVGTANELDAGYAADGYARRRGLGALCTTFGVGELSALNAIAGAYAEHVPIVQITGAPATRAAASGALLHHTLGDGDFEHTLRAAKEFTAFAITLTTDGAADQIDRCLALALDLLRPVHLAVPADLVSAPVDDGRLARPLARRSSDPTAIAAFRTAAEKLLLDHPGRPVLLVGHLVQRLRLQAQLRGLAEAGDLPVAWLLTGKGVLDEDHPLAAGLFCGDLAPGRARDLVNEAAPLITVGALLSDVQTGLFSHRPDPGTGITLDLDGATVAGQAFHAVPLADALDALTVLIDRLVDDRVVDRPADPVPSAAPTAEPTPRPTPQPTPEPRPEAAGLTQAQLWSAVQRRLPAGGTLVTDIGTAFWGAAGITLPADTAFEAQPVWSSIGYALPATLGCALAEPERRAFLIIGDGAAQMTAAELGLLAVRAPGTVVLLIDNCGYTIERVLRNPQADYHEVATWDWERLAVALAPTRPPLTLTATDPAGLDRALDQAVAETGRMTLLRVVTEPTDVPPLLAALGRAAGRPH
jgi:indolepyruvate decarboxylase